MRTTRVSSWKTKIRLGNKVIYLENSDMKRKEHNKSKVGLLVSRLLLFLGCIVTLVGFFMMASVIGRQDMISDVRIEDYWTLFDYVLNTGVSVLLLISGGAMSYLALKMEKWFISEFNESR